MKVILTQDVRNIGRKGEIKEVAEGYARNFLMPKNLAKIATDSSIKEIERQKEKEKAQEQANLAKYRTIADGLKDRNITIKSKEKGGKLFGSITTKEVAQELKKEGLDLTEKNVMLDTPIKKLGKYVIKIKLMEGIETSIILTITGEK